MIIIDDIKSLYRQLTEDDPHDRIAFNELAYGRRVGGRTYAFCPFCKKVIEFDADKLEEKDGRIRLRKTAVCDCRKGLRYISKAITLEQEHGGRKKKDPYEFVRKSIKARGDLYKRKLEQEQFENSPEQKRIRAQKEWEAGLHAFNERPKPAAYVAASVTAGMDQPLGDSLGRGYDAAPDTSYIPDDFEPEMDAYDRQALYEEQLLDDWVIASGGNPFDYGDRVDAFTDPFGFHDDFGGGDGGFGGFGSWGGGDD